MSNDYIALLATFAAYGIIIMGVAAFARSSTKNLSDYVLGGRRLSGPIIALGAGASDMSSWLLMVLPGIVYAAGFSMIWMPVALSVGAYVNWLVVSKRLRIYTEVANDSLTIPAYLSNRFQCQGKALRIVTSIAMLIFFTFYSVAGFVAGALLTQSTFSIEFIPALLISSGVIVAYTTIGGFLAVSWVDFFQGSLMLMALLIVPCIGFSELGGIHEVFHNIANLSPSHLDFFTNVKILGLLSLFAWGLGYFGQPHIIVRFMAIRSTKELPIARRICIGWMVISLVGAIFTGLVGFLYYQHSPLAQQNTVFIALSQALFNPWIAGVLLSAVLSAIMSTVSAQILMVASILAEDFYHGYIRPKASDREYLWVSRISLILVSIVAIWMASNPDMTLFQYIGFTWSGLGASFGPAILFSLYWRRMTRAGAIWGISVGMVSVLLFEWLTHAGNILHHPDFLPGFALLPGFIFASITLVIVSLKTPQPSQSVLNDFDKMKQQLTKQ